RDVALCVFYRHSGFEQVGHERQLGQAEGDVGDQACQRGGGLSLRCAGTRILHGDGEAVQLTVRIGDGEDRADGGTRGEIRRHEYDDRLILQDHGVEGGELGGGLNGEIPVDAVTLEFHVKSLPGFRHDITPHATVSGTLIRAGAVSNLSTVGGTRGCFRLGGRGWGG